jgi:hypothetical protein
MKVLMLRNPRSFLRCDLHEGETGDVSKRLGEVLIDSGIAVEAKEDTPAKPAKRSTRKTKSSVKGVADKPAVSETKPAEIAGTETDNTTPSEGN